MTAFPVPLDNLITYVKALHPDGGPLENVSDAFSVSTQMDEQADALIGYFVDQARRSGLSWSQIGGAMGVSKQAAQKRFVPTKAGDLIPKGISPFSRFTIRAANVLAAAGRLAAPGPVDGAHLAAALLTEPDGLAAKAVTAAGVTPEQFYAAVGAGPAAPVESAGTAELLDVTLDEDAKEALKAGLKSALRLGHNYIGTEHLLLGLLSLGGPVTDAITGLGLPPARAEELITAELAGFKARKEVN
jgi:Clp amino terminal domain, pathogenicity island component